MYRAKPDAPSGTGRLVTFRRYPNPVVAQLDRAHLAAEGIEAHVFGEASHNMIAPTAISGVELQVREGDLERVEALLHEAPGHDARDDGETTGVVRCPRCELAYCFHERMNVEGKSATATLAFFAAPFMAFFPKRWHCHKCGHAWDDAGEGPPEMTKLGPDDPRPVFRLRRSHAGMGLFLGLLAGGFATMLAPSLLPRDLRELALLLFPGALILGWSIGRSLRHDVCSDPACRAPLTRDREDCPRCKGDIAGVVRTAEEHYAAAGDFRRELAASYAKRGAKKKKSKRARPGT